MRKIKIVPEPKAQRRVKLVYRQPARLLAGSDDYSETFDTDMSDSELRESYSRSGYFVKSIETINPQTK